MGREFEVKYAANTEQLEALRFAFPELTPIEMETNYYDTPDAKLGEKHWTLRRRYENGVAICTVKTPGTRGGRGEWEVHCDNIEDAIPELCKLGAPEELLTLTADGVTAICGAKFTRLAGKIDFVYCTAELALDEGILMGGGREIPLMEVEVELKSGSEAALIIFAETLAEKYMLLPEPNSKYSRALALAKGVL